MKVAAARAIASIAHSPVPDDIARAYGLEDLSYGPQYILPKPFDRRLLTTVAPAVVAAAQESGVAAKPIENLKAYANSLRAILCANDAMIDYLLKAQACSLLK
jgi:malate dehydrogenase (oxaloacetate-decarboxylating)(NADP+)